MSQVPMMTVITTDWGNVRLSKETEAWLRGIHPKWAEISAPVYAWDDESGEQVMMPNPYQGEAYDEVRRQVRRLEDAVFLLAEIRAVNNQDLTEF